MKSWKVAVIAIAVVAVLVGAAWSFGVFNSPARSDTIYYKVYAPKDMAAALASGQVAGVIGWEPYVSDSVLAKTGKILVNSKDIWPDHPCCVLVAQTSLLESNPALVKAVLAADVAANKWIVTTVANKATNPDNYTKLLEMGAAFSNRNTSVVEAALADIVLDYNVTTPAVTSGLEMFTQDYINANFTQMSKLTDKGYSSISDFVTKFVNASLLNDAASVNPSAASLGTIKLGYLTGDLHQFARIVASNETLFGNESLFAMYGVTVKDPNPGGYSVGGDIMTAMALNPGDSGRPDMAYLGCAPTILKYLNGDVNRLNVRIVALANSEGSALVVALNINSVKDLAGKVVADPGET
ncbi:MAG: ABC transporter substrate-binding protein, partial [Methanomassiliicoccales archaeon]